MAVTFDTEDANHDGHDDITLKFKVADIGLISTTTSLTLTGETNATPPMKFTGDDDVTVKK